MTRLTLTPYVKRPCGSRPASCCGTQSLGFPHTRYTNTHTNTKIQGAPLC